MTLPEKIQFLMARENIKNKKKLSEHSGIAYTTIVSLFSKGYKNVTLPTVEKLADFFHVTLDYLCDESITDPNFGKVKQFPVGQPYDPTHRIPILGRISAGLPLYAEGNIEGYTFTSLNGGAEYFALRVRGDSMNAAGIGDGNLIIVRRQSIVEDGQVAVVLVDDEEATVKRYTRHGEIVTLMPQSNNPTHMPQVYSLKETRIEILGLVVRCEVDIT